MAKFCIGCGKELPEGMMFCSGCGTKIQEDVSKDVRISNGAEQQQYNPPPPQQTAYAPPSPPREISDSDVKGTKYEPISAWGFIGIMLLMCIPIIGQILVIVWACGGCRKLTKRAYARASLILMAIALVISLIIGIAAGSFMNFVSDKTEKGINDGKTVTIISSAAADENVVGFLENMVEHINVMPDFENYFN